MKLPNVRHYATHLKFRLFVVLVFLLSGCGSGSGGGGGSPSPPSHKGTDVGIGSVSIADPSDTGAYQTELQHVNLKGTSFVPAGISCPVPWPLTYKGILAPGYTVTWSSSSSKSQLVNQSSFQTYLICQSGIIVPQFFVEVDWETGAVPLDLGDNTIIVTATDGAGNVGRDKIVVTRVDYTPPAVQATNPTSGASLVATNNAITVQFSEAMDPASISSSTILLHDNINNAVSGSVAYSNQVATFTPTINLLGSTSYTASVTTGVKDIAGNSLSTAFSWWFTTGIAPDLTPPTVTSTSPSSGAICAPTESHVLAAFSKSVEVQTVNPSTFTLKDSQNNPVSGAALLDYLSQANFLPSNTLANSTNYTSTITTGLADLAGNHLVADYTWSFTTQSAGTGLWSATNSAFAPVARSEHTAVWTGTQMIVWGGKSGSSALNDGARYDPSNDTWTPISIVGAPSARSAHVAVWTGSKMIVWGGLQTGVLLANAFLSSGAIYDPYADTWKVMSLVGAPSARQNPTAVWTGSEMIIWGGAGNVSNIVLGDGARYNPATDSWSPIATTGAPTARWEHTAVWNGTAMLIWGGIDQGGVVNTGSSYNPSLDAWAPIATTGSPTARRGHTAAWTGNEMIVWGGHDASANVLDSGARFNTSTNTWQSMSTACAPLPRAYHAGVWTGTELIIWGGSDMTNTYYYKVGGRYNPSTDIWQATPVVGMPNVRIMPTGIWTGSELIVWGGLGGGFRGELNTGGRYLPQ